MKRKLCGSGTSFFHGWGDSVDKSRFIGYNRDADRIFSRADRPFGRIMRGGADRIRFTVITEDPNHAERSLADPFP